MPIVTMRVFRGDARGGDFRDYNVEAEEGMVVLDVIHRIQATQAVDLACRWNCKAGKCGSCSAEVNGKPRLMCMTRMNLFPEGEIISVAPIRTFPLVRDLVTDVSYNYEKAKQVPPLRIRPRVLRNLVSGVRYSSYMSSSIGVLAQVGEGLAALRAVRPAGREYAAPIGLRSTVILLNSYPLRTVRSSWRN